MAAERTGTLTCGLCDQPIELTFTREGEGLRLRIVDAEPMRAHLDVCAGMTPIKPGQAALPDSGKARELRGRIHVMLDGRHYMATAASGACTMCGINRQDCLDLISKPGKREPCCQLCRDGNTHPAPEETWDCQVWAAQHGAKS